jgi:isoleucyl-tRNA synthetase
VDKEDFPKKKINPKNILDKWIISKINNLIRKATKDLDEYNISSAVLSIENFFIEDLSLWYIRRSRERFHKGADKREKAISTLYYLLLDLLKLIAPIMPFLAEEIYNNLKTDNIPESIHLSDWPEPGKIDNKLEEKMNQVREIVNLALAQRAEAKIKVRQPLARLTIKNKLDKELSGLIRDEVNVKEIIFDNKMKEEIKLDTEITEELEKEGRDREWIRSVNAERKKLGLTPNDIIVVQTTEEVFDSEKVKKEVKAEEIIFKQSGPRILLTKIK